MINLERPAETSAGTTWLAGRTAERLTVILRAPGCVYALRSGGCTNCGFHHLTTGGAAVPSHKLVAQLRWALQRHAEQLPRLEHLDIYCSGSFLNDLEIPPDARRGLLEVAASIPALRRVLVESRPANITAEGISAARSSLGEGVQLEVAIGLESVDDDIRLRRIRKGFSLESFVQAAEILAASGAGLVVYLLLKPMDTGEREAIEDTLASGRYLHEMGRRLALPLRIALEPAFVPLDTPLHQALIEGRYAPPSLWSALEVVRELGGQMQIHVGLNTEGLPVENTPRGCDLCTASIREALEEFNRTQALRPLAELNCQCQNSNKR